MLLIDYRTSKKGFAEGIEETRPYIGKGSVRGKEKQFAILKTYEEIRRCNFEDEYGEEIHNIIRSTDQEREF